MNATGKSKGYLESHAFSLVYKVLFCLLVLILKLLTLFGQFILFVGKRWKQKMANHIWKSQLSNARLILLSLSSLEVCFKWPSIAYMRFESVFVSGNELAWLPMHLWKSSRLCCSLLWFLWPKHQPWKFNIMFSSVPSSQTGVSTSHYSHSALMLDFLIPDTGLVTVAPSMVKLAPYPQHHHLKSFRALEKCSILKP